MNSVKIGHQEWSSENLNVDHFNNGDEIQQVESAALFMSLKLTANCRLMTFCIHFLLLTARKMFCFL